MGDAGGWFIVICAALMAAAAWAEPPAAVADTFRDVNARIKYRPYAAWDYRYVAPGTWDFGNCAVFAQTYLRELHDKGVPARIRYVKLPDGRAHVYVQTADGWVLDNMKNHIVKAD